MDQYSDNNQTDFLWKLLANPADDAHLYAYNLQCLVTDFPQSGILHALYAHASEDKNLKQASTYFGARALYKLINNPSSFIGVPQDKIFIQNGLRSNGHTTAPTPTIVFDEYKAHDEHEATTTVDHHPATETVNEEPAPWEDYRPHTDHQTDEHITELAVAEHQHQDIISEVTEPIHTPPVEEATHEQPADAHHYEEDAIHHPSYEQRIGQAIEEAHNAYTQPVEEPVQHPHVEEHVEHIVDEAHTSFTEVAPEFVHHPHVEEHVEHVTEEAHTAFEEVVPEFAHRQHVEEPVDHIIEEAQAAHEETAPEYQHYTHVAEPVEHIIDETQNSHSDAITEHIHYTPVEETFENTVHQAESVVNEDQPEIPSFEEHTENIVADVQEDYHEPEHIQQEHQSAYVEPVEETRHEEAIPEVHHAETHEEKAEEHHAEASMPVAEHQHHFSPDIEDETFDEIVGIEDINTKPEDETDRLIRGSAVASDYFSFDRAFGEHKEPEPVKTEQQPIAESAPVEEPAQADEAEKQDVSKYHDEKMPYSFMWWLDKTRKEHADTYQPYVKADAPAEVALAAKKPEDELQQQYYENIFHITSVEELDKHTTPKPFEFGTKGKEQVIIERFIQEEPQIRPQSSEKLDNENKAKKSSEDRDELVTETLAGIYSDQMLYHKAIYSYKKLMLKFPEKSRYFAEKIELLEKKTN